MVRQTIEVPREEAAPRCAKRSRREIVSISQTLDALAEARCPLCRARLVARLGRGGPYFFCRCPRKPAKLAS